LAKRLDAYPWSSYGAFIDKTPKPAWLETDWLLSLFGKQQKLAARNYQLFVEEVAWDSLENPAKDLIGGLVLGNTDFVNWVKFTFLATPDSTKKYHTQLADFDLQPAPDTVVDVVSETFGCDRESVLTKGRKRNIARDTAIYLARNLTGKSNVFLGEYFGGISGAGITGRYNHVVQQLKTNPRFKIRVNRIKKQLFNTLDATPFCPIGRTGARIILTLMGEMLRKEHDLGQASLCIGGGQGMAAVLENP
jgi:hypothetical protein